MAAHGQAAGLPRARQVRERGIQRGADTVRYALPDPGEIGGAGVEPERAPPTNHHTARPPVKPPAPLFDDDPHAHPAHHPKPPTAHQEREALVSDDAEP